MYLGVDCSEPPTQAECVDLQAIGVKVVAGYIGGYTPHVWTPEDWSRCRIYGFKLIPVWVAPPSASGHDLGANDGNAALSGMQASGLTSICCLDIEANFGVDACYARGFSDALSDGACDVMLYGKALELSDLPDRLCTWLALPELPGEFLSDTVGAQLKFGPRYDWSLWDEEAPSA